MYDVLIIGGGPAGLTAALYAARANKKVCVVEKEGFGGQIARSPRVENIPGVGSVSGAQFADALLDQVIERDVDLEVGTVVSVAHASDGNLTLATDLGDVFWARTLIVATGVKHRPLNVPGSEEAEGRGISYCVTCDGDFCRGKEVAIVGGGNSAATEALALADMCSKVTLIHRRDSLPRVEPVRLQALKSTPNIELMLDTSIVGVEQDERGFLQALVLADGKATPESFGQTRIFLCNHLFVSIGLIPDNRVIAGLVDTDDTGYILAREDCRTRQANIFVAGDCRTKSIRQVTTACADGSVAALAACSYLDTLA